MKLFDEGGFSNPEWRQPARSLMQQNKKTKVAWLYTHLLFRTGGTRFVLEVTRRLQESCDVDVIVEKASPEIKKEFSQYGIEVRETGLLTSTSMIYWLFFPLMLWINEKRVRRETKDADVVISGMFPMNVVAAGLNKPTIQNCWEPFAFFYDTHMINGFTLPKRLLIKTLAALYSGTDIAGTRKSDIITTLNHSTGEWLRRVYGRDGVKTYMGVDADFFRPVSGQSSQVKRNEKIILHSTDYTMMKGTGYLVEALPLILDKVRDVKVVITHTVENKKERDALLKKAKTLGVDKNMEFIGTVPYDKLPEHLSHADLVAFTGHPESIGTTASLMVLEAMACETPVVRSIGCDEEVEDGVSGILVDPRDKVKLSGAIVKILMDKDLGKKMGKEGRNRVVTLYNWDRVCSIFSGVIESAIQKHLSPHTLTKIPSPSR